MPKPIIMIGVEKEFLNAISPGLTAEDRYDLTTAVHNLAKITTHQKTFLGFNPVPKTGWFVDKKFCLTLKISPDSGNHHDCLTSLSFYLEHRSPSYHCHQGAGNHYYFFGTLIWRIDVVIDLGKLFDHFEKFALLVIKDFGSVIAVID